METVGAEPQTLASPLTEADAREMVRKIIEYIGDDPARPGLLETPDRVLRSWKEIFSGYDCDPIAEHGKVFDEAYDQIVVLRGCEFTSLCEHHMLPFSGTVSIGYLADGKVIGLSKLARIADAYARRLQVQERLTNQIAHAVKEILDPKGVAVVVEASHSCMTMRGVSKQRARMTTSAMLGAFRESPAARAEMMALLRTRSEHE